MAKISALSGAVRKTAGAAKKPAANIMVASDLSDPENPNHVICTKDQVIEAIDSYAEGHKLEEQGKALKEMHRPTLTQFVQRNFCKQWVTAGSLPENPKVTTNESGTGTFIGAALVDREMKLDENQFAELSAVIGEEAAEKNVKRYDEISFNNEKLNLPVIVKGAEKTVLEVVDEAITNAFKGIKREDLLEGLFEVKEVFTTKKGLLPQGLQLVGGASPGAVTKLYDLLNAARVITMLKPGNTGTKD